MPFAAMPEYNGSVMVLLTNSRVTGNALLE
jgi:hypothetical protein